MFFFSYIFFVDEIYFKCVIVCLLILDQSLLFPLLRNLTIVIQREMKLEASTLFHCWLADFIVALNYFFDSLYQRHFPP